MLLRKMKPLWSLFFASLLLSFVVVSCDDDDDDDNPNTMYQISGTLSGSQEVPPVTTTASGTLTGTYNASNNVLTYNLAWNGLSDPPSLMHFHGPAAVGVNANPVITITIPSGAGSTGTISNGTATLTEAQEADLLGGRWYVNIHTPTNGGGEIRAQVIATQ